MKWELVWWKAKLVKKYNSSTHEMQLYGTQKQVHFIRLENRISDKFARTSLKKNIDVFYVTHYC